MEQHNRCYICKRNTVKLYRCYGSFLRDDEILCKLHRPENLDWFVPLVEDVDGSVWGYTSVPDDAIKRWELLSDE